MIVLENNDLVSDMKEVYARLRQEFDNNSKGMASKKKGSLRRSLQLAKMLGELSVRISRVAKEEQEQKQVGPAPKEVISALWQRFEDYYNRGMWGPHEIELWGPWLYHWNNASDEELADLAKYTNLTQISINLDDSVQRPIRHLKEICETCRTGNPKLGLYPIGPH